LRLAPGDGAALANLSAAYEQLGRPQDLARVREMQIERLADDPATQAEYLRRLARLSTDVLQQPARALRAWENLVRVLPADREALDALGGVVGMVSPDDLLGRIFSAFCIGK
jgi:tRNA U34 5-carboxymethylaminomethyl modifying GTPase MnmE/TrmE